MAGFSRERVAGAFDRLGTSYKLLILLSLSLLPFMLIALLASWQASRNAFAQHRDDYQALAVDQATTLNGVFAIDRRLLSTIIASIERGEEPAAVCARAAEVTRFRQIVRPLALFGVGGSRLCATPGYSIERPADTLLGAAPRVIVSNQSVSVVERSTGGNLTGVVFYDAATLAAINRAVLRAPGVYDLGLTLGDEAFTIAGPRSTTLTSDTVSAPMRDGVELVLTIAAPGASASDWVLALTPILMWLFASATGFFVVDRLLLRPLEALRAGIAATRDGIPNVPDVRTPAHEIRDLADALTNFAADRATHDGAINAALDRQTALTREVHHRVKNNLQVIASLISLHSRATQEAGALEAFAAIQRRVDALAIVHRNHYAHSDQQGALELKPVLSELIANLLTNLPGARVAAQLPNIRVTLDTATALTFLVTEFVELSTLVDRAATVAVDVAADGSAGRLCVRSPALSTGAAFDALFEARYGRILNGLVRQLRAELQRDEAKGEFWVEFGALPPA